MKDRECKRKSRIWRRNQDHYSLQSVRAEVLKNQSEKATSLFDSKPELKQGMISLTVLNENNWDLGHKYVLTIIGLQE